MVIRQSTGISSALASFAFRSMQTLDGSCFLAYRDAGIGLLARLDEPSQAWRVSRGRVPCMVVADQPILCGVNIHCQVFHPACLKVTYGKMVS